MTPEAYSYYFKVRTFGSVDVSKLASIAMGMARETSGCFIRASNFGEMQKSVFYVGPWSLVLATYSLQRVQEEKPMHVLLLHIRLILGR